MENCGIRLAHCIKQHACQLRYLADGEPVFFDDHGHGRLLAGQFLFQVQPGLKVFKTPGSLGRRVLSKVHARILVV
jgi:hypothetical protein